MQGFLRCCQSSVIQEAVTGISFIELYATHIFVCMLYFTVKC